MRKNVPKSSKIHRFIKHTARRQKRTQKIAVRFVQKMRKPIFRPRKINSSVKYGYNSNKDKNGKKYFRLFCCNFPHSEYKNVTHKANCTRYRLSNDIEKNPGPLMHGVDPTKTIQAPCSQGDVHVFGQNAGQQRVAMSLCALIYHNTKGISNSGDLKQITHIGNQLYSSLSQLARCSYLLLTELPAMLTVAEENFRLEYSASYSGNVHGEATTEGYEYCFGLKRAFESLISQQYRSFILTVGCITVGIVYCVYNGHFKVFDSHARGIYGKSHRQGTCVLLDIPSKDNLIEYFQSLYGIHQMYELKGLQITKYDITTSNNVKDILNNTSLDQHKKCLTNNCLAVAFYSICYSIISLCSYWN